VPEPYVTIEDLERLPEARQLALMGLAGLGLPAGNSHLARVLAEATGWPQARAWAANPRSLQDLLLELQAGGLARSTPRGYWSCTEPCLESAARMAFARGVLRRLFQGAVAGAGAYGAMPDARARVRAELRLEFLEGRHERWLPLREQFAQHFGATIQHRDPLALVCGGPFEPAWFEALEPGAQAYGCQALLLDQVLHGLRAPRFREWLEARSRAPRATPAANTLLLYLTLQGRTAETAAWMQRQGPGQHGTYAWAAMEGMAALAAGDPVQAAGHFAASLARLQKVTRKRAISLPGLLEPFHILALLGSRSAPALRLAQERIALLEKRDWDDPIAPAAALLRRLSLALAGGRPEPRRGELLAQVAARATPLIQFLETLAAYLGGEDLTPELAERVERSCAPLPLAWFSAELGELRRRLQGQPGRPSPLLDLIPREAAWERVLDSLQHLGAPPPARPQGPPKPLRLTWLVSPEPWSEPPFKVEAREQRQDAKGHWGKGRLVSLRRLREETRSFDYLSPQDQRVLDCVRVDAHRAGGYALDAARALGALVGHPQLLWAGPDAELEVELLEGQPELRVSPVGDQLELSLAPAPEAGPVRVLDEGPRRKRLFQFTELHRRLVELLGEGLRVPAHAQERVLCSLAAVAPMVPVRSDLGITEAASARAGLEPVAGCATPSLILLPAGSGLRARIRVHPLDGGPAQLPGQGGSALMLEQDGRRLLVRRDLAAETRALAELLARLPALPADSEDLEWLVQDPELCLDLLLQAEKAGERNPVLWPEGRHLQAPRSVGPEALRVQVASGTAWLELDGQLQVDRERVLDLKTTLALLEAHPGRFIPLGDGAFMTLSQAFRRRLQDLAALGDLRGQRLRLPAVAALGLEELGLDLAGDPAWSRQIARLRKAMTLEPALPATLEAELRPYQEEGFRWMLRLAEAGMGACLADDMGLGKTVQALAVLLARGARGPALVVAPTSVCANWEQEAARFAPGLRVLPLAGADRAAVLDQAGPMDLVIASYALLHLEAERLQRTTWSSVILDEAQNIKNAFTKRSQSAMALRAEFRLGLSGTPMENHLGELWNLFRFLNPGLLGSLEQFQRRYQVPVERNRDPEALRRLRRLTGPFLLRRTKAQVLEELPARTEITLELEPGPEEAAFLEALRIRVLEQLDEAGPASGQPMQVLAGITRLRRACCSPELAQPGLGIPGAKHEAFLELVAEIRDNRHRALVFSQFVDHLALLRRALDQRRIPYHYLDGATPARARAETVAAFQRGDRDLFLISLKAGGTGLNLTGADYVIHMDPWWNPAVEDQASDRAHRIGQTRPVTIYRLVLRGSIEQKIVHLHARKRQLADQLLETSDTPARLDAAALLELLRA